MIDLVPFDPADAERWDAFCADAAQATLLHTRRFLAYHGDRFKDRSLVAREGGRWLAVLLAAEDPTDARRVISHPGVTYGGVLHNGAARGERMIELLQAACAHYRERGYTRFTYRPVPTIYQRRPAQDDLYALWRIGAQLTRRDLNCVIDLQDRYPRSEGRRRSLRRALAAGVEVTEGHQYLPAVWSVLQDNLWRKHGAKPLHSLEEITGLAERFPDHIRCVTALAGGEVIAGTLLFVTPTADHSQYIAASDVGYECSAMDAVFAYCIDRATTSGQRWFAFGTSNEQAGRVLNDGLYRFKSEFGGGGIAHDHYDIDL